MNRFFGILLLFFSSFAFCNEAKLKSGEDIYTLYPQHKDSKGSGYFGVYRHVMAYTGGRLIYLFPDFSFVITEFCDICKKETIGNGTFSFQNSRVIFKYNNKPKSAPKYLLIRYGRIQHKDYITGDLKILVNNEQLKKIEANKINFDYIDIIIG